MDIGHWSPQAHGHALPALLEHSGCCGPGELSLCPVRSDNCSVPLELWPFLRAALPSQVEQQPKPSEQTLGELPVPVQGVAPLLSYPRLS